LIANARSSTPTRRAGLALAREFYVDVFGCVLLSPERDYSGADLAAGTGIPMRASEVRT
jgi:hypothetical protein